MSYSNSIKQSAQRILERTLASNPKIDFNKVFVTTSGFDQISKNLFRVRLTASNAVGAKPQALREAVKEALGSGVVPVVGSFQPIVTLEANNTVEYVGLISKGVHTQTVATASVGDRFTEVAKNVLMDNTDESVWNVVSGEGGATVLARQVDEDLSDLVAIAKIKNNKNRDFLSVLVATANIGQYARFFNPNTQCIDHGYVCGTQHDGRVVIASRTHNDLVDVDDREIIVANNIHCDDREFEIHRSLHRNSVRAPSFLIAGMKAQRAETKLGLGVTTAAATSETPLDPNNVSYTDLRDYYRQVFAYNPEYYAEFEKIISAHGF